MEHLSRRMGSVLHFDLPRLPSNLAFDCHPDFAFVSSQTDKWIIDKLNVVDELHKKKIVESRIGMFACMMHPHGATEKLILATKHLWIMFMVDDVLESSTKEEVVELKQVIWEISVQPFNKYSHHPCLPLYNELMADLRTALPHPLFSRYLKVLTIYLDAVEREVDHTLVDSSVPSPATYRQLRRDTGFMEVMGCIMTEFCLGLEVETSDTECKDFQDLIACMSDHVVMVNDLFSFRKEFYEKPTFYSHNWLAVLLHDSPEHTSFQEIVYKLHDMIQEEEDKIVSLQQRLVSKAVDKQDDDLLKCAEAIPMAAAGHLRWSYITARYHGCNNTLLTGEMFHGTWLLHPEATVILPTMGKYLHEYLITV